ncbi:nucleotidyltransferase domain-containing protein, partial [Escherichia coli]
MREAVIAEVSTQLSEVVGVIERHLEPTLLAVHLYGSAVDGGLKPHSDIDLLVTVTVRLDETTRRALINDLLETSASPGESEILGTVAKLAMRQPFVLFKGLTFQKLCL